MYFLVSDFLKTVSNYFIGGLILLSSALSFSQEFPPIQNYNPKDYGAENQNWSISQDKNKFIYVANNQGLLEFNGAKWTLYPSPNQTIFRSVKVIGEKIFTGFYMDFGFWERNNVGKLQYTSLVKEYNLQLSQDEQFWNIINIDGWTLFQSFYKIYLINTVTKEHKVIESESKITKLFKVGESVYFHKRGEGIFLIDQGVSKLYSDFFSFKRNNVIDIYKNKDNIIVLTDKNGFYIKEGKNPKWNKYGPYLDNVTIYNSCLLRDNGFAIGTISNGVLFVNEKGFITNHIDQKDGINNNTVLSVFEDSDKNIWLGLDNGISVINKNSNIEIFRNNDGTLGTTYSSVIFNGFLYLGTNQGLFFKRYNSIDKFSIVEGTQGQVWSLDVQKQNLFCSHDAGIFIIKDGKVDYKIETLGTWKVKNLNKDYLISGEYVGLSILEKKNGKWSRRNKLKGFSNSSKYFEVYKDNSLFVNHEYKGIFKLKLDSDFRTITNISSDTAVKKGIHSGLIKYKESILYSYRNGVYKYSDQTNKFIKDEKLSSLFTDSTFVTGKLIYEEKDDILWGFSSKSINYLTPGKLSNEPIIFKIPITQILREGAAGYENLMSLPSGKKLIGTYNGYILIDLKNPPSTQKETIRINNISVLNQDQSISLLNLNQGSNLENNENNLEFNYSVVSFNKAQEVLYQYKINDKEWSNWSTSSSTVFNNLKFGDYVFKVRAKVGNKISVNVASYEFSIKRPWYLSDIMITLYVISFLIIIYLVHISNKRYYKRKGKVLLEKQQKEFELQELANEKELVLLKNEQLKIDVESKNRELATSTMSMIKKNEFLNTIKSELRKVDNAGISKVIKIIDKNLNNTDDWKLFSEAFNNADKGFIKKVKSIHPDLTPNDLRLCAYLRLNLPSKEIAPLLNISHRSVEVKRYRLRKKMNLDHKQNLTDYILNL